MTNHTVVLSGGLDSTNALALAMQTGESVRAIGFFYGQRHARELSSALAVADHFGVEYDTVDLSGLLHGSALLGAADVPEGHYAEDSMKATVVHGRNLLFASAAVAAAGADSDLWFGVHAGDHPIYPDCRPEFWDRLGSLVVDAYEVVIHTPFLDLSKGEALRQGAAVGAPFWLTWSCYQGGDVHCGKCGTCVERAEAFAEAGLDDPTEYADAEFWRTVTA